MQSETPRLILASSSPYRRKQIQEQLGQNITSVAPDIDETPQENEDPETCALRLSCAKAQAVRERTRGDAIIIASDQTAALDGQLLKKPLRRDIAIEQLLSFSGRTITFYSGLCVVDTGKNRIQSDVTTTSARFRTLNLRQIETYVDHDTPLDCVGAFKNESLGIALFEAITSNDPSALTGLPLISLTRFLANLGVDVLTTASTGK